MAGTVLRGQANPIEGLLRTNLRRDQTYDQIALFIHDNRLPTSDKNKLAGKLSNGYNYGVFNLTNFISNALHGTDFEDLTKTKQNNIIIKAEHDISDHMPAWIRLPIPGANYDLPPFSRTYS